MLHDLCLPAFSLLLLALFSHLSQFTNVDDHDDDHDDDDDALEALFGITQVQHDNTDVESQQSTSSSEQLQICQASSEQLELRDSLAARWAQEKSWHDREWGKYEDAMMRSRRVKNEMCEMRMTRDVNDEMRMTSGDGRESQMRGVVRGRSQRSMTERC